MSAGQTNPSGGPDQDLERQVFGSPRAVTAKRHLIQLDLMMECTEEKLMTQRSSSRGAGSGRFSRKRTPSTGNGPNAAPDDVTEPGLLGSLVTFEEEYGARAEADGDEGHDGGPQRPFGELIVGDSKVSED